MSRINVNDMATSNLPPEGIYKFRVETIDEVDKVNLQDEKYTVIESRLVLLENGDGPLKYSPSVFENFYTDETGIDKFTSLYKAITGRVPEGTIGEDGEFYVDTEDLLDEIRGGEAYGAYQHLAKKKQDGSAKGRFGYKFGTEASKVRMPKKRG